jgi:imidazole glycerol phosphate synthase subunit HisF
MGVVTRVIPCLDVAAGRVVKGVRFENLREGAQARVKSTGAAGDLPAAQADSASAKKAS